MAENSLAKELSGTLLEAKQALQIAYLTCQSVDAITFEKAIIRIDGVITRIISSGENRNG